MLQKKICLSLLLVSTVILPADNRGGDRNDPPRPPLTFQERLLKAVLDGTVGGVEGAAKTVTSGIVMAPLGVLSYVLYRKALFYAPENAKYERMVSLQSARIDTSKHLKDCIEALIKKREAVGLNKQEEERLINDKEQVEKLEAAIRKSTHQFEKPSREMKTTGWFYNWLVRPVAEILPD